MKEKLLYCMLKAKTSDSMWQFPRLITPLRGLTSTTADFVSASTPLRPPVLVDHRPVSHMCIIPYIPGDRALNNISKARPVDNLLL